MPVQGKRKYIMKISVEQKRALQKGAIVSLCVFLLCASFLSVPYIAAGLPQELAYYLTEQTPPGTVVPLSAQSGEDAFSESVPAISEPESSAPTEESPSPNDRPPDALSVFAESFCRYDDPADAALYLNNLTSYKVDPQDYLRRVYPVATPTVAQSDEPLVLILHTHGSESYLPDGTDYYLPNEDFRSENASETVVAVGETIAKALQDKGIPVLHDTTMHDLADFNSAYANSRAAARAALKEHPSIKYIIDVHRDSIFSQKDVCQKTLTEINGTRSAQLMLVVGTDEAGAVHPNWRSNLTVAVQLQDKLNSLYPTLARPINLRDSALNQALLPGCLLLEVGSCGNTVEEACTAGTFFADAFAALLAEQGFPLKTDA